MIGIQRYCFFFTLSLKIGVISKRVDNFQRIQGIEGLKDSSDTK